MLVYLRRDHLQEFLRELGAPAASLARRVVVCDFDDHDVFHVHLDPAGRIAGRPGHGLLIGTKPPPGRDLEALSSEERLALMRAGLKDGDAGRNPFLAVFAAAGPAAVAFWYDPDGDSFRPCAVRFTPGREELFDRTNGLLETDQLARKTVGLIGVGSGGSVIAVELAKCGVGQFHLVDFDRLELHNVARHSCGVSDVGRYKTRAVRDLLLDKNPHCAVHTHEDDVLDRPETLETVVRASDVVVAGTDNNDSRRAINKACLRHNKVCLFGRLMLRAAGGDVLRVRPGIGPCYECFMETIGSRTQERVADRRQADAVSYADHRVTPEPGLSNDILPVPTLMVKLALQELVRGTVSGLESLDQDLTADLYLWANRREGQYAGWAPMGTRIEGMAVLRWYGVGLQRRPECSHCGRFMGGMTATPEQEAFFGE